MKTTNFFTEISKYAESADIKLTMSMKDGVMTVSILPELKAGGQKIMPFTASGTAHELDEGFMPELEKAISTGGGFKTNTEVFAKAVETVNAKIKEDAEKKALEDARKEEQKKNAPVKKNKAPAKKKTAKPAAKKPSTSKPKPKAKPKAKAAAKPKSALKAKVNDGKKPIAKSEAPASTTETPAEEQKPAIVQNSLF